MICVHRQSAETYHNVRCVFCKQAKLRKLASGVHPLDVQELRGVHTGCRRVFFGGKVSAESRRKKSERSDTAPIQYVIVLYLSMPKSGTQM